MASGGPDIAALLSGLGAGGAAGPGGPGGPPPSPDQDTADVSSLLQDAIDALHKAFGAETEPIDKQMIAKALQAVQDILANEQKEKDQAMGGSGNRILRRAR